jgi:hypothetical protein
MLFLFTSRRNNQLFENMQKKAGKQYFKRGEHLTEATAQFGTDRTWQSWDSSGA